MKLTYIYALRNTFTGKLFYVGKSNNPINRYHQHLSNLSNDRKCYIIDELIRSGFKPELVILAQVPEDLWREWERGYIKHIMELGHPLTNKTRGGDGGNNNGIRYPKDVYFYEDYEPYDKNSLREVSRWY